MVSDVAMWPRDKRLAIIGRGSWGRGKGACPSPLYIADGGSGGVPTTIRRRQSADGMGDESRC